MSSFDGAIYGNGDDVGNFCYPNELPMLMIKIICPPLGVFWEQSKCGFPNVVRIIKNFIFTTFFYFPGLIYAINEISCRAKVRVTEAKNDELMAKHRASGKSLNDIASPLANSHRVSGANSQPNSVGSRIGQSPMPDRGRAHTVGNPLSDIALPTNSPFKEASVNPFDDVVPGTNFPERERQHANSYGGIALSRAQTSLPSTIRRVYKLKILLSVGIMHRILHQIFVFNLIL